MGCLNWRESRAEGRAEQKSSDLIPVQARDWLSRKRNPVRPPVSPVPAKPIFKEGMLEGRLDPHVQFQSPMETRSNPRDYFRSGAAGLRNEHVADACASGQRRLAFKRVVGVTYHVHCPWILPGRKSPFLSFEVTTYTVNFTFHWRTGSPWKL
jgi:hypothetical protein